MQYWSSNGFYIPKVNTLKELAIELLKVTVSWNNVTLDVNVMGNVNTDDLSIFFINTALIDMLKNNTSRQLFFHLFLDGTFKIVPRLTEKNCQLLTFLLLYQDQVNIFSSFT